MKFFNVLSDEQYLYFPHGKGILVRGIDKKDIFWKGDTQDHLFGKDLFNASGKTITVTEGAHKAMSVFQMTNTPSVSVHSSSTALRDCKTEYSYLNSFDTIILSFDSDNTGQKATQEVSRLFKRSKIKVVLMSKYNDPTDYLEHKDSQGYVLAWMNAKPYRPKGITGDFASLREKMKAQQAQALATFPFSTLQEMTFGIYPFLYLVTAQQKIGKTEFCRALEHHILRTTDHNLGIIHLEENEKRSIQGLVSYELRTPIHLPTSTIPDGTISDTFEKLCRRDNRMFFFDQTAIPKEPEEILEAIRYLVTNEDCKIIVLDHMTQLVSGSLNDDERKTLDFLATHFGNLTTELGFALFVVSHVNDDGQPRGSRMIAKTCNTHIALTRDKMSMSDSERNTVRLFIPDNRFSGMTGPAGELSFDPKSFTLEEKKIAVEGTFEDFNFDPTTPGG